MLEGVTETEQPVINCIHYNKHLTVNYAAQTSEGSTCICSSYEAACSLFKIAKKRNFSYEEALIDGSRSKIPV